MVLAKENSHNQACLRLCRRCESCAHAPATRTRSRAGLMMDRLAPLRGRGRRWALWWFGLIASRRPLRGFLDHRSRSWPWPVAFPPLAEGKREALMRRRGLCDHRLSASWVCEPHQLRPVVVPVGRVTGHGANGDDPTGMVAGGQPATHAFCDRSPERPPPVGRPAGTAPRPPEYDRSRPVPHGAGMENYVGEFR